MRYSIEGRSTGQGAYTTMRTQRFNESRTGNHWEEAIELAEGQQVKVVDISGTGKHRCYVVECQRGEAVRVAEPTWANSGADYWTGGPCPVCYHP